jgi:cobalt-zinc-cadmium efflux system protein
MGHSHADHDHSHSAGHDHAHAHAPADFGRAFAIGVVLNAGFVAVEAIYGLLAHSTALLADAGHNLSDVLGLLIAWGTAYLAKRAPSKRFTYGFKGSTILAALFNALLLLVAIGAIMLEAVQRFGEPVRANGHMVMAVALVGIVINGVTALMFARGRKDDLNIRGAYLHMAADAAVSAGVVVSGALTLATGLAWIDPVTSLIIVAVIFWGTWGLLRHSLDMSLGGVPAGIDLADVEAELAAAPGVSLVHDLHVWHMSTTEVALTAHLVVPGGHEGDAFLAAIRERIGTRFGIHHSTIQVETGDECVGCD